MAPTPQHFCSDCHSDLKARLPDTRLGNAGDFGRLHPQFQPILVAGWDGNRPLLRRASLDTRPREDNGLKFPHALHLAASGGVAQMARTLGMGSALGCRDCHQLNPDGARFRPVEMERNCGMCHGLAFDRVGGTVRTLRHGDPAQVIADLRALYPAGPRRRRPASRPSRGGAAARGAEARTQHPVRRGAGAPGADAAIRAVFSPGGACYDCHRVIAPPPGSLAYGSRRSPCRRAISATAGSTTARTRPQSCTSCHAADRSQSASDLLIPGIETCRTCHGGERTSKPVASSCAMCHDYHRDEGAPAMLIRQQVRGQRRAPALAASMAGAP